MSDDLDLGVNDVYKDAILHASKRTGMEPQAIAAVISAEAARGRKGVWNPKSKAKGSSARGLTQFLKGTWLAMAKKPGTLLNERSQGLSKQEILDLRDDPELSIVTAAEYDSSTLANLQKQGVVPKNLTATEKAQYAYMGHHEGEGGASKLLRGTLTQAKARSTLGAQVGKARAAKLIDAAGGDAAKAYKDWLTGYIHKNIQPDRYRGKSTPEEPPKPKGTLPSGAKDSSGGPRINDGEPSVLIGGQQWMVARVQSPHEGGGKVVQGSDTVFVGKEQLPFTRKGDVTNDGFHVKGDTQPDVLIG